MRRTKEIKVRMTEEEFDRVTALAQATVFSREEFIRKALRGTTIRERPPAEYGEIIRELRRIGSIYKCLVNNCNHANVTGLNCWFVVLGF